MCGQSLSGVGKCNRALSQPLRQNFNSVGSLAKDLQINDLQCEGFGGQWEREDTKWLAVMQARKKTRALLLTCLMSGDPVVRGC